MLFITTIRVQPSGELKRGIPPGGPEWAGTEVVDADREVEEPGDDHSEPESGRLLRIIEEAISGIFNG